MTASWVLFAGVAHGQTRTPWQMHDGLEVTAGNPLGLVPFACAPGVHGDPCEYDVANIPTSVDPGWRSAPDGDIINFSIFPSRVCSAPGGQSCLVYGDFSYFQTFVDIPLNVVVTQFTIAFNGMDDGSRVTIFNSSYPTGFVVPGSYVFLGGSGTTDLSSLVRSGEVNRVVVTQVDDCCIENNLRSAVVVLNGVVVHTGCNGPADCDDANACTSDVCNPDGSCSHPLVSCDDGNACTLDTCNPSGGCAHVGQCPDCSSAAATLASLWPPNHKMVTVGVKGVTDPQGQSTTISVLGVGQDEPTNDVGDGNTCPDAGPAGGSTVQLRAERSGTGNGRVYHILFSATDPDGYSCSGEVTTCVPHDQGRGNICIDDGASYDALTCQ